MPHDRKPNVILAFAMVTMVIFTFALGLMLPLIAYRLNDAGYSYSAIILSTVISLMGVMVAGPLIGKVSERISAVWLLAISLLFSAILALFIGATTDFIWLSVLRFLQGICTATTFIVSETWINQTLSKRSRGLWIGIYMATSAAGFGLGPLILAGLGTSGWLPFICFVTVITSPLPFLWYYRHHLPSFADSHGEAGFIKALLAAPLIMVLVMAAGYFDSTSITLVGPYMVRAGIDESITFLILSSMFIGNALLQIPVGYLTKYLNRKLMVVVMATFSVAMGLMLPEIITLSGYIWFVFALWGAAGYGVMTIALVEVGDRFEGRMLVLINTAFATTWGLSGIFSALSGVLADSAPERGVGTALAVPYILVLLLLPFIGFVNKKYQEL